MAGKQQQCVKEDNGCRFNGTFCKGMIKDQVIEIIYVKSAENESDVMTKNQQGQHYLYAKSKLVYTVQEMNKKKEVKDIEDKKQGGC